MGGAVDSLVGVTAYMAIFSIVGVVFLFANLLVGRFLRPHNPHPEKLEVYECGEPTIGSSYIQFDIRFYVVALLFIIFDVEVAFFFPWATVFGKAIHFTKPEMAVVETEGKEVQLTKNARDLYFEMGVREPVVPHDIPASLADVVDPALAPGAKEERIIREGFRQLAFVSIADIVIFFAILMVGFAYVWKRGDLDWVRAVSQERSLRPRTARVRDPLEEAEEMATAS